MTSSGKYSRPARIARPRRRAAQAPAPETGSANHASWLLWLAGLAAITLSAVAFVLWTRNGAGILLDMMLALCL